MHTCIGTPLKQLMSMPKNKFRFINPALSCRSGMSLVEAMLGLFIISLVIISTANLPKYLYSLQYVMDSRIIDGHFNRIHRLLSYGNCDSFKGDRMETSGYVNTPDTDLQRTDNTVPEIKVRQPKIDPETGQQEVDSAGHLLFTYKVLYAVQGHVSQLDPATRGYQPVETLLQDSHLSIKSMSFEKDPVMADYAILKAVFWTKRAKRAGGKSKRLSQDLKSLSKSQRGEFERSLRIWVKTSATGEIETCGLSPSICLSESREVHLVSETYQGGSLVTRKNCLNGARNPSPVPKTSVHLNENLSGKFFEYEYKTNFCICSIQFYCQDGFWNDNTICMERP